VELAVSIYFLLIVMSMLGLAARGVVRLCRKSRSATSGQVCLPLIVYPCLPLILVLSGYPWWGLASVFLCRPIARRMD
jgi:hypothetical protein